MPRLAVVIVSWNVRELLVACLSSLIDDLRRSEQDALIWVVDNASVDGTAEVVTDRFPDVRLISNEENVGFAAGNNLALKRMLCTTDLARGDAFVWLLNPDTEVQPGAAGELVSALDADPGVGVAGAKLLYPDGALQHSAFRFPGLPQLAFELLPMPRRLYDTPLNGRYPPRLYRGDEPFEIDHPLGASMMVRLSTIRDVGLLDERYHMYCEEIDWCWRMAKAGWDRVCVPSAEVVHHAGRSTSQIPVESFVNLWKSRARLYSRHYGGLTWPLARALVCVGMRRRMRGATPKTVAACEEIIQVWKAA